MAGDAVEKLKNIDLGNMMKQGEQLFSMF